MAELLEGLGFSYASIAKNAQSSDIGRNAAFLHTSRSSS